MKELFKKDKKSFYISLLATFVLVAILVGATYAYFIPEITGTTTRDVSVTSNTTDTLTFQVNNDIAFRVTQDDFAPNGGDRSGFTNASATLTPNNKTGAATDHYYMALVLETNGTVYSAANTNNLPELLLQVYDSNDDLVTLGGLGESVTIGNTEGYDITGQTGLIQLLINHEITASSSTPTTETWRVVITLINHNFDQNENTGKEISGYVVMSHFEYSRCLVYPNDLGCDLQTNSGDLALNSGSVTYHNGEVEYTCDFDSWMGGCDYDFDDPDVPNQQSGLGLNFKTSEDGVLKLSNFGIYEASPESPYYPNLPYCSNFDESSPEDWEENGAIVTRFVTNLERGMGNYATTFILNGSEREAEEVYESTYGLLVWDTEPCFITLGGSDEYGRYANRLYVVTPTRNYGEFSDTWVHFRYVYNKGYVDASDKSHRYSGANPNNYLCLPTGEAGNSCDPDDLYRIIGIVPVKVELADDIEVEQYLYKVIKNTPLSDDYFSTYTSSWFGSEISNSDYWSASDLNIEVLNGTYLDSMSKYSSKMANVVWNTGGFAYEELYEILPVGTVYKNELANDYYTYTAKIGLMYVGDYAFAAPRTAWRSFVGYTSDENSYAADSIRNNNWLYTGHNEWLLSPTTDEYNSAFYIGEDGLVDYSYNTSEYDIRPVFYLNQNTSINKTAHAGTLADPYVLD